MKIQFPPGSEPLNQEKRSKKKKGKDIENGVLSAVEKIDEKIEERRETQFSPNNFNQYIGQPDLVERLSVFTGSAKSKNQPLDHLLIFGPPGLGKTTLANVVANEMGVCFLSTTAPTIAKIGDLVAMLSSLEPNSVFFIDEIHRLDKRIEEVLYSAMENFFIDIILGQGPGAQSVKLPLSPFTLIGATTRAALVSGPLQTRFGIIERIDFYQTEDLAKISKELFLKLGQDCSTEAAIEVAKRARGTPRIVKRLTRRVSDFASYKKSDFIDKDLASAALDFIGIDSDGLDWLDRKILSALLINFDNRPVGLDTLAAIVGEDRETIELYTEPYLLRIGIVERTPRGRKIIDSMVERVKLKLK